ncbi:MAG: tetratricopeptide repeat protein [Phycisphaerae bacterium]|jgi:tetratricopeptide (TPR) repeat protein
MDNDRTRIPIRRLPVRGERPALPETNPASTAHAAATDKLARSFGREPELILACLETEEPDSPRLPLVLAAAEQAIAACPNYADLRYAAAQVAVRLGRHAEARSWLDGALELNPGYRDALILAARVAMAENRPDEALPVLQRALAHGADYADVHVMLGEVWKKLDDVAQAAQAYRRALEINGDLASAQRGLATCVHPE